MGLGRLEDRRKNSGTIKKNAAIQMHLMAQKIL
jgi:hypothetical protein